MWMNEIYSLLSLNATKMKRKKNSETGKKMVERAAFWKWNIKFTHKKNKMYGNNKHAHHPYEYNWQIKFAYFMYIWMWFS